MALYTHWDVVPEKCTDYTTCSHCGEHATTETDPTRDLQGQWMSQWRCGCGKTEKATVAQDVDRWTGKKISQ